MLILEISAEFRTCTPVLFGASYSISPETLFIEYMAGRSSGKYLASHPSWYRKHRQLQANRSYPSDNRVIADSSFGPEPLLQPYPLPDALPYSQIPTNQQKLNELGLLLGKFSSPQDVHKIVEWTNITLGQGPNHS